MADTKLTMLIDLGTKMFNSNLEKLKSKWDQTIDKMKVKYNSLIEKLPAGMGKAVDKLKLLLPQLLQEWLLQQELCSLVP